MRFFIRYEICPYYSDTTDNPFLSNSFNFPLVSVTTIPPSVIVIGVPDFTWISDFSFIERSSANFAA